MNPAPEKCPLCGEANECQLCSHAAHKGQCWCASVEIPAELIARVPEHLRNRACICQKCVTGFHRGKNPEARPKILPGDFYFDAGMIVFTAAYHQRRGWCCGTGCRHCPFPQTTPVEPCAAPSH
jgi:hypothetical protein